MSIVKIPIANVLACAMMALFVIALSEAALAAAEVGGDARQLLSKSCTGCHSIDVPKAASQTVQEKMQRKGPPLHYAGHKYQSAWLTQWLQNPQRITPSGGAYWANTVIVTDEGDEIDEDKLQNHIVVNKADAELLGQFLSSLKPYPALIAPNEFSPKKVNSLFAKKDFRKFKGCSACHRDTPDFGGVSGPELYTGMNRLKPSFVASYIKNPVAWDPRSIMPNKGLNDVSIQKLMNYLHQIKRKKNKESE